jgi:hypothetical protein
VRIERSTLIRFFLLALVVFATGAGALAAVQVAGAAPSQAHATVVPPDGRSFLSDGEVAQVKQNAATYPWAAQAWSRFVSSANGLLNPQPRPPDPGLDYRLDGRVNGICPPAAVGWYCSGISRASGMG